MLNIFMDIINYIDAITKVVGWIIILVSMFLLLHYQLGSRNAIYNFFKEYGINRFTALKIAIECRKDWHINTRFFIEYVILHNTSIYITPKKWNLYLEELNSKYLKKSDFEYVIEIENTFVLRNEFISQNIDRYFRFFDKVENRKKFSIDSLEPMSFVAHIKIKDSFVSPLVQISSLQQRYAGDWSKILKHYINVLNEDKVSKFPSEISSFYTWLMWGPSVFMERYNDDTYKMCLLGLGDESMAIQLIIKELESPVWKAIEKNIYENKMGTPVVGVYRLFEQKDYLSKKYSHFGKEAMHHINAILESEETSILLEATDKCYVNKSDDSKEYLFSAYIWVMLYYYYGDEDTSGFDCKRSTVFYEHANIADGGNIDLLTETLSAKCIKYLEEIFANAQFSERIYCIPWAINANIKDNLCSKIKSLRNDKDYPFKEYFVERIDLGMPKLKTESILVSIDNEFSDENLDVKFVNINFNDFESLGILGRFYCELYIKEFPDANERETLDNIINQAKYFQSSSTNTYHCVLAIVGQEIVGGIIGDYFSDCNCGVIEFVVVEQDKRKQHIGSGLISNLINFFNKDAKKILSGQRNIDYCFFEVENPDKVREDMKENCIRRLQFWKKKAAKIINVDYIQPALDSEKEPVDYLYLGIMVENISLSENSLPRDVLLKFVDNYFTYAIGIENAKECDEYKKMLSTLSYDNENIEIC